GTGPTCARSRPSRPAPTAAPPRSASPAIPARGGFTIPGPATSGPTPPTTRLTATAAPIPPIDPPASDNGGHRGRRLQSASPRPRGIPSPSVGAWYTLWIMLSKNRLAELTAAAAVALLLPLALAACDRNAGTSSSSTPPP